MMKRSIVYAVFLLVILACGLMAPPSATQAPAANGPPIVDATVTRQEFSPLNVNLAGPQLGTSMSWVNDSLLIYVSGGDFIMGTADPAYVTSDSPEHTVSLSGFWIYRHKVTNAQYASCVAAGQCAPTHIEEQYQLTLLPELIDYEFKPDFPVISVDWGQADAYCRWIGGHLPTEAQWEKTARGPTGNLYPWGDQAPHCGLINFNNCFSGPSSVHRFPDGRSFYEAFDMLGSAYEWGQDWYAPDYYNISPRNDPPGPASGQERVMRGSGFRTNGSYSLPFYRNRSIPTTFLDDLSFRCVVEGPTLHPPYCQVPAYMEGYTPGILPPGQAGDGCQPPSVQLGGSYCSSHAPYTNLIVSGNVGSVESGTLHCSDQGNGFWACTGNPTDSQNVTVCGGCGQPSAGAGIVALACPPSYQRADPNSNFCSAAGLQPPLPGDACPAGFQSVGGGMCVAPKPSGLDCPIGSYLDSAIGHCVGAIPVVTDNPCLPGEIYDPALMCCAMPPGQGYPGICPPGEAYNPSIQTCSAIPSPGPQVSCVSVKVGIGQCNVGGQPLPGRDASCQPIACKDDYVWDQASCSCVFVPP